MGDFNVPKIGDKLFEALTSRGGQAYGATDDFGCRAIASRTQTSDLHATMLHQLGLDHEHLTFNHNSRDERLTDVYKARVIQELIA